MPWQVARSDLMPAIRWARRISHTMMLLLGTLAALMGVIYLVLALKDGFASDKSGWILARRQTRPVAYWTYIVLFSCMAGSGLLLIVMALSDAR